MSSEPHMISPPATDAEQDAGAKLCSHCGERKPLGEFLRRTGRRSGKLSRRGACKSCRKRQKSGQDKQATVQEGRQADQTEPVPGKACGLRSDNSASDIPATVVDPPKRRTKRPLPDLPPKPEGPDPSVLRTTRQGTIRMRGKTDKGRRWYQETDLETAVVLVREHAAVVVNPYTIRRIYNNKSFRRYILARDRNICHFCGEYGDTIDHLLPRAKGGHTTPANCVCACNLCNQSKAALSLDEFMESFDE